MITRVASTSAHLIAETALRSEPRSHILGVARRAITEGAAAFSKAAEKPHPKLEPVFINPLKDEIETRIEAKMESEKSGITHFFHGTHHIDSILKQAETNPEGKLDRRSCDRGDEGLGLYGTSCPKETAYYSGAEFIVRVASEGDVHFDPSRGTPALKSHDDKYVMEVFKVVNRNELLSHVKPSIVQRAIIAASAALEVLPKTSINPEKLDALKFEMEKPIYDRA
jgi:hypothetical protein